MKIKRAMSHILSTSGAIASVAAAAAAAEVTVTNKNLIIQAVLTLVLRQGSCRGHVGRKLS